MLSFDSDAAIEDVLTAGGHILVVLILALIALWLIQRLITPVLRVAIREQMAGEPEIEVSKRIETLSDVVHRTVFTAIALVGVVTVLPEFGVNAGPLIAGLGLVGLAVGFGAQNLVKDVINGVEILIENQYGRGDFVKVGGVSGVVEDINLRRTVLRDLDGAVHFVSHSLVEVTSNYTRGYSRVIIDLAVASSEDLDGVFALIDETGQELARDPEFGQRIRQAPKASGIERLGDASLEVRVEAVTEPGEQWLVAGELRRRLKRAFDAAGIKVRDSG